MPNFDGTGPLKRGRLIGRGMGPCAKGTQCEACTRKGDNDSSKKQLLKE